MRSWSVRQVFYHDALNGPKSWGEIVPHPHGMEFEIVEADPRRVKKLRLRLPDAIKAAE